MYLQNNFIKNKKRIYKNKKYYGTNKSIKNKGTYKNKIN